MRRNSNTLIPKRIAGIRFALMDPNEIRKMSAVEVKTADTYKDDGHAFKQGLMDPKMGVIEPGIRCDTCGNKNLDWFAPQIIVNMTKAQGILAISN